MPAAPFHSPWRACIIGDSAARCPQVEKTLNKYSLDGPRRVAAARTARWLLPLLACAVPPLAHPAETLRYVVQVEDGTTAGHQVVTRGDDGVTKVEFAFKNNGRGPQITEEYRLAADGTYAKYQAKGTTTFGATVDESFTRTGNEARWRSTSDSGTEQVEGTALYTALGGTPNGQSVALGALAKRPDGKLPLIPGGTLTMRKMGEAQVRHGADVRTVQLIMLTGVGLHAAVRLGDQRSRAATVRIHLPGLPAAHRGRLAGQRRRARGPAEAGRGGGAGRVRAAARAPARRVHADPQRAGLRQRERRRSARPSDVLSDGRPHRVGDAGGNQGERAPTTRRGRRRSRAAAGPLRHARPRLAVGRRAAAWRRRHHRPRHGRTTTTRCSS